MRDVPTYITDNFPCYLLDCQYCFVCSEYIKGDCDFDMPCAVRKTLRDILNDDASVEGLRIQIENIMNR